MEVSRNLLPQIVVEVLEVEGKLQVLLELESTPLCVEIVVLLVHVLLVLTVEYSFAQIVVQFTAPWEGIYHRLNVYLRDQLVTEEPLMEDGFQNN